MAEINASHLRGVVIIPAVILFRRHGMGLLDAPGDGLDQLVLKLGCASGKVRAFEMWSQASLALVLASWSPYSRQARL
jgi:hypothetical protein